MQLLIDYYSQFSIFYSHLSISYLRTSSALESNVTLFKAISNMVFSVFI